VGVDDLYNNKWKSKQTTCMQKYIGLNTNNLHNNNIKMVKINEILSEECVFCVLKSVHVNIDKNSKITSMFWCCFIGCFESVISWIMTFIM
jgi:hypothetical protein